MSQDYNSIPDTLIHIRRVQTLLARMQSELAMRAIAHDTSKLESPEKEAFDLATPRLKASTYGSEEYKSFLADLKPALEHHYAVNSHHPEHFRDGIAGMSLLDLVEMLCDWKAAGERHADGSMAKSLEVNRGRFKISDQLFAVLNNTAKELNWI